ncbi:MAG: response regulator [Clostridiales bacterium]|nr:response regulator [Clostridiales bacterium]
MNNSFRYKKSHGRGERALCAGFASVKARVLTCVAILLILATSLLFVFACPKAASGETQSDSRTYKACVFNFAGYHMKDDDGKLSGYGIEFLNLVSKHSRLNFQYVDYDLDWNWSVVSKKLEDKEFDVVTSVSWSEDRAAEFAYSMPIGRKNTVISIRENDTRYDDGDYSDYNGMRIGLLGNNKRAELDEFIRRKGFTPIIKNDYKDDSELAAALKSGEIDAIVTSDLRKAEHEKTLEIIGSDDFYAIVRKDAEGLELLREINYAIGQMDINEGDWKNTLYYKYYGPAYSDKIAFTAREIAYVNRLLELDRPITVTAFGNNAPYSYTENGTLKGIMPDYFAELMKVIANEVDGVDQLPYTFVAPKNEKEYAELVNTVDVVIDSLGAEDTYEDDDKRGFNTESYMSVRMARVTRNDHSGSIKTIAVSESQGKSLLPIDSLKNNYIIKDYATGEAAMRAVQDGKVDAAYVYAYTAQVFVDKDTTDSLYYSVLGLSARFTMHVGENADHELITILNKCIKYTPDDTINQLSLKYITYTVGELSFWEYLKENPIIIVAVLVALALIIGVIVVLYLRGRWNKKLLHNTEQSNKKMGEQLAIVEALSRDYTNVYSINEKKSTARIIKLEGYVTEGINKDSTEEYDYKTILENYIRTRVHPDDQEELIAAMALDKVQEQLREHPNYMGSYRILDGDEVHHLQYAFLKISDDANGNGGFILVGFRNIDEVIRKEQEQKVILEEALAQAQYANKAKTTFLNNMSHDIRTPMNAIIGFTSLATTHAENADQVRSYLGKIMTSGNHLLSLINDVLDMSRIESGKVKIEEKETSLPEIMHDLKTIVQADVKSKQLEFYLDTLDVTNETIICDKLRLNQVLLNILSNAMKYTKPGGTVSVRVAQTGEAEDGYATFTFSVKDTGIGMSPEFLKHVFEPFEREQTATVSGIQGTGLGLAITKNIVDMMNGTIKVKSELGKGSEFIVTFRFRVADAVVDEQKVVQLENQKALVVDDDVNTCMSVSKMLSSIGMRPDWTTLAKEAIVRSKFAVEQNDPYSVYIIDWLMPDMNGVELVRRLRKAIGDEPMIIINTAYDWSDMEKEAKEAGVTAFCSKPLFVSELRKILAAPFTKDSGKQKEDEPQASFDGKKILLVEDNELNQEIAQSILEMAGFVVDTADDGSIAVDKMKKQPAGTYDLILMDVQMPIMNGYEATKAIRAMKTKAKANIPIVAMTANAFEEDKKEAFDAGMNGYAAKPIEIDKLMETLRDILNK